MTHDHHPSLPGYAPEQILHDGCGECERRGADVQGTIEYLDLPSFARAWTRAADWQRSPASVPLVSHAEAPLLRVLWACQYKLTATIAAGHDVHSEGECAICVPGQCPGPDCPGWLGAPNPAWWEAAQAGRCSHGGHDGDGETCSDAPAAAQCPAPAVPRPGPVQWMRQAQRDLREEADTYPRESAGRARLMAQAEGMLLARLVRAPEPLDPFAGIPNADGSDDYRPSAEVQARSNAASLLPVPDPGCRVCGGLGPAGGGRCAGCPGTPGE